MADDDFDSKVERAADKLQKVGGSLTLWVTLPILIFLVIAYCVA